MTTTLQPDAVSEEDLVGGRIAAAAAALAEPATDGSSGGPSSTDEPDESVARETVSLRPVLAAAFASSGAALVVGGIFGSWSARIFDLVVVLVGAGLAAWALRSKHPTFAQAATPIVILAGAALSVLPEDPTRLSKLVRAAVDSGRLLRPPVPFDPGWRPLLTVVLGLLSFSAAWIGAAWKRPVLGVVIPLPIIGLAAITQPQSEQVLAGVFAFLPLLAGFGVLYGAAGGSRSTDGVLQRDFELKRALRGGGVMVGLGVALVLAGQLEFLFPAPTVNPNDRPQKPKSVPLSASVDRVLFTVKAPDGFSGPWRTGALDVYEDNAFKLAGGSEGRLRRLDGSGTLDTSSTASPSIDVDLTTADLGPTAVLPTVPTSAKVRFAGASPDLRYDPRPGVLRFPAGRAPSGLHYTLSLPPYPNAEQLAQVRSITGDTDLLAVPPAPPAVRKLLAEAPPGPWARLDFMRHKLLDNITAVGAGSPTDITAARVQDMLAGRKKGSPFEIVAAQALLARWAGVPSRIGFGFNGVNDENGAKTVRPRNAAQWLEVRVDGFGWLPLLDVPPKAQASLNNDNDDQRVAPSSDIAVEVFVPVQVTNPRLLFQQLRAILYSVLPFIGAAAAAWLLTPFAAKLVRRRRRERWADALGPRGRVAVAYAEMRDVATDLAVGDPFATPLEYLSRVVDDPEHIELAWLVSRAMYGDLAAAVTDADADAAERMAASVSRRLRQAQPLQVRVVAFLSKGSLHRPYTDEVPGVRMPTPFSTARRRVARLRRPRFVVSRTKVGAT